LSHPSPAGRTLMYFRFNAATGYPGAAPARVQRRITVFKPNRTIQFLFGRWLGPFSLSCILILAPDNLRPFHLCSIKCACSSLRVFGRWLFGHRLSAVEKIWWHQPSLRIPMRSPLLWGAHLFDECLEALISAQCRKMRVLPDRD